MARRQRLSETQIAELFDPPTEQRELVRHYTLSETDWQPSGAAVATTTAWATPSCVAICAIPVGLCVSANGRLRPLLAFIAEQIGVFRTRLMSILQMNGTDSATPSSAKSSSGFVTSASMRQRN